jgi:signal transduction histidine kinase
MVQKQNMKAIKLFIILLIITMVSCTKKTQTTNSRNDSVEKYLKLASIDTLPFDLRKKYNQKAFEFIDLERNDTLTRWYLGETVRNFSALKDSLNYYKVSKLHFKKSVEAKDTLNLGRFYRYRGGYLKNNRYMYDSAYYYYTKAEKLIKKTDDSISLGVVYHMMGKVLYNINDYSSSELSYKKAENIFLRYKQEGKLIQLLSDIGNNYAAKLDNIKAIKTYQEGIKKIKEANLTKDKIYEAYLYSNLAAIYSRMNNKRASLHYNKLALNYPNLNEIDPIWYNHILRNFTLCKEELKIANDTENQLLQILRTSRKLNDMEEEFNVLMNLSDYYFKNDNMLDAQKCADSSLILAKKTKVSYNIMNAWKQIGIVNKEKAAQAIIQYDKQTDSVLNRERRERSKFFKIQLETDEITQEKEKAIKQKWVQTSIIATVLLIVILLFIIFKQRSQKKEFLLFQNQQKANEEIYQLMLNQQSKEEEAKQKEKKRIALELHDNVMNKLASTRFNLFTLTQKKDDQTLESAISHIDKIKDIEDEIRHITHELSKETFSKTNSFTTLLTQLIEQQNQLHTTDFSLQLYKNINWDNIGSEIKMNFYRIIQEAIHNINKHAKASKAEINIELNETRLQLSISDNGIGFQKNTSKNGIGLHNMQQRIASINGKITVQSSPGKGTMIKCTVNV